MARIQRSHHCILITGWRTSSINPWYFPSRKPIYLNYAKVNKLVGQRLYDSKITRAKEYQPVGLMLLGAPGKIINITDYSKRYLTSPGTDEYLIDLVKHVLVASNRPLVVKTGKVAFWGLVNSTHSPPDIPIYSSLQMPIYSWRTTLRVIIQMLFLL